MADLRQEIQNFLASFPAIVARFGDRIWPGPDLPPGFDPTDPAEVIAGTNQALLYSFVGGDGSYIPVVNPIVTLETWGATTEEAGDGSDLLIATLWDQSTGRCSAHNPLMPQYLTAPSGWPFATTRWTFRIRMFELI